MSAQVFAIAGAGPDGGLGLDGDVALLRDVLARGLVRSVFQPVVDLDSGSTVGYEALSRGPHRTALERPDWLFAVARRHGLVRQLDALCRQTAQRTAARAGVGEHLLFVNSEPEVSDDWLPAAGGHHYQRLVVEVTERSLLSHPAELLGAIGRARALGWHVALDDVGADPASLALMPLIAPDVIKLDMRLVQSQPTADIAVIVQAVQAQAERSGAVVLAEGLETERHVAVARSFGATLGQGFLLGRPGPLPSDLGGRRPPEVGLPVQQDSDHLATMSPFGIAAGLRPVRVGDKRMLIEVSKQLEAHGNRAGEAAVVISSFQDVHFLTAATCRRYEQLVAGCAFVGALGDRIPPDPMPGVRGATLLPDDPLRGEWDVAVLGPHFSGVLVARDLGDTGPDMDRRFGFVLSHDRDLTVRVARALMARIRPEESHPV